MRCNRCHKKEATLQQVFFGHGLKQTISLCASCFAQAQQNEWQPISRFFLREMVERSRLMEDTQIPQSTLERDPNFPFLFPLTYQAHFTASPADPVDALVLKKMVLQFRIQLLDFQIQRLLEKDEKIRARNLSHFRLLLQRELMRMINPPR
ncbi:MAG TPA: hypothetical protein P5560_02840 [Thermotogota bacterium]|nr:hypothetical protein [Thermotogota bacterium]HRW91867.1 hypothetical protein [Thermotogota bacterium]